MATDGQKRVAEEIGRLLARAGAVLVCGGMTGVMESACKGARTEGGATVGLLPGGERAQANPYVSVALPTGLGVVGIETWDLERGSAGAIEPATSPAQAVESALRLAGAGA